MNRGYVLTPLAKADLDDFWNYVAGRGGFDVAAGMLESLHRALWILRSVSSLLNQLSTASFEKRWAVSRISSNS